MAFDDHALADADRLFRFGHACAVEADDPDRRAGIAPTWLLRGGARRSRALVSGIDPAPAIARHEVALAS
jgi:hypothetical protein